MLAIEILSSVITLSGVIEAWMAGLAVGHLCLCPSPSFLRHADRSFSS